MSPAVPKSPQVKETRAKAPRLAGSSLGSHNTSQLPRGHRLGCNLSIFSPVSLHRVSATHGEGTSLPFSGQASNSSPVPFYKRPNILLRISAFHFVKYELVSPACLLKLFRGPDGRMPLRGCERPAAPLQQPDLSHGDVDDLCSTPTCRTGPSA